jgi:hypothetical protein
MKTLWVTGYSLMPAWGFFPNPDSYGSTKPLGPASAWTPSGGTHRLTWVADVPETAQFDVWIRRYGGYGKVSVLVNEMPLRNVATGQHVPQYVWCFVGTMNLSIGQQHVDIDVTNCMIDAVLLTSDPSFEPNTSALPAAVPVPTLRALRRYRDDSALKDVAVPNAGYVVAQINPEVEVLYDDVPMVDEVVAKPKVWGSPRQTLTASFVVRMLDQGADFVTVAALDFNDCEVDIRVMLVRERTTVTFGEAPAKMLVADLLLRSDGQGLPIKGEQSVNHAVCATSIPAHESRQFILTIRVPAGMAPGSFEGSLKFEVDDDRSRWTSLPVSVEILPIDLQAVAGRYGAYHLAQPINENQKNEVSYQRYQSELKDMAAHGLNCTTMYAGVQQILSVAHSGLDHSPCSMIWPGPEAAEEVAGAKQLGLEGLTYYGVDEPITPEQIARCVAEAERRQALGLTMMTAINNKDSWEYLKDLLYYPVLNLMVFDGKKNAAAEYANSKGFKPVSYWPTTSAFPMYYRAFAGLYNAACSFLGAVPWAYQDTTTDDIFDADTLHNALAYPDESGNPVPTLCWEFVRQGIDDVRYLQALDRSIVKADERMSQPHSPHGLSAAITHARKMRRIYFEAIGGRYFVYLCGLVPGQLDEGRRAMADATVALNVALSPGN